MRVDRTALTITVESDFKCSSRY